ncbi:MAG: ABC transporter substrate-binding protein [Candidatus Bathyarchaeia archaeon]
MVGIIVAVIVSAAVSSAVTTYYIQNMTVKPVASTRTVMKITNYVGGITTPAAAVYAADVEGFYLQNGISLSYVILSGTSAAVQAAAADRTGYAFTQGDIIDMVLLEAANPGQVNLLAIALLERVNPVTVVFLKSSGIMKPTDLKGKTVGVPFGSLSAKLFPAFAKATGLDPNSVNLQNIDFSALHPALLAKKVDAVIEFSRGVASATIEANKMKDDVGYFSFGDYGIPPQMGAIVVQKGLVQNHPEIARAIVNATLWGYYFAIHNPEAAIKDFLSMNPGRDYDQTLAEWKFNLKTNVGIESTANLKPLQMGWFDTALVSKTVDLTRSQFDVKAQIDPNSLFTNQFVEKPP